MARKIYNKLVRDKIPEIIKKSGSRASVCVLTESEFKAILLIKLQEEVDELKAVGRNFRRQHLLEELVDIYQVIRALRKAHGFTEADFDIAYSEKWEDKGGFEKRLFLEYVDEPDKT